MSTKAQKLCVGWILCKVIILESRVLENPYLGLPNRYVGSWKSHSKCLPWACKGERVIPLPFKLRILSPASQHLLCWPPAACYLSCRLFRGWQASFLNISLHLFQHILSSRNVTNELPWGVGTGPQPAGANYFFFFKFQANWISVSQVTGQDSPESCTAFLCCVYIADPNMYKWHLS